MHDDEAPPRLSVSGSPELRTALRGLAERSPESERLTRMARNVALATGLQPELLMPTLSDSAGAPPQVTLEPAQTQALTTSFGAGAKIAAASAVVAVTGLLGYWASTDDHPAGSVRAGLAAVPALASVRAIPIVEAPHAPARSVPSVPKPRAPRAVPPGSRPAAPLESNSLERPAAHEKRSPDPAQAVNDAPAKTGAQRAAPTATASAARHSPPADEHARTAASDASEATPVEHDKAAVADELGLLHLAQSALRTSPAQALHLVDQHRKEFPRSALAQERDLIHVSALVRLGRTGEARSQAERFRRAYPRSAYRKQLEGILPER